MNDLNQRLDVGGKLANTLKIGMLAAGAAITGALVAGVREAMAFEEAMAGVNKIVGAAQVEAAGLDTALIKLTRTLPNTSSELATIAASGASLGVAVDDLAAFTELAAKMGVAFDMSADESGTAMAKLSNVLGVPLNEIENVTNAINFLSDNTVATASDMTKALVRVGGVTRTFGLDAIEAAALTNAFVAISPAGPEEAATAITAILPRLQNATLQTDAFKEGLERIGLSAEQMETNIREGPMVAFQDFLARLGELSSEEKSKALGQLFMLGGDARYLATLANDATVLSKAVGLVGDEANYAGSMQREFENRAATTLNKFKLLRNAMNEILQAIGGPLLAPIAAALDRITPVFHQVADFLYANPLDQLPSKLGIDTSTLQGLIDGAMKIMGLALNRLTPMIQSAIARIGEALPGILFDLSNAIGPLFRRIARAVPAMINNVDWEGVRSGLLNVLRASSKAFTGMFNNVVGVVRRVVAQINWHELGVQVGNIGGRLIGLAAVALTQIDWGNAIKALMEVGVAIARFLAGAIGGFALGVLPGLGSAVLNILGAGAKVMGDQMQEGVTILIDLVVGALRALWNNVKNVAANILNPLRRPAAIVRAIATPVGNMIQDANSGPAVSIAPTIATPTAATPASLPLANTIGSRADGQLGNLLSAAMTETRRKPPGSDLVVANSSETILPANTTIATTAPRPAFNPTVIIQGASESADAIANRVMAKLQMMYEQEYQGRLA